MKITSVEARDLSEAWFLCLRQVLTDGYEYTIERGSYSGQKRKELDMITVHIKNPGNRPLIPDVPPGVPAPSTMEYIDNYLPYLMTAHRAEGEQYTYGQYLEAQIAKVIKMYKETGFNTNQAFMTVGNPETLDLEDPPCLRSIDTRVRYGKLHFIIYFRSWDLWAGFPSNLAAIQMLKEYMAAEIGVEDGEIIAMSKGMHIYDYAWDIAKTAAGMNGV
ncbi:MULTISPECIES: thymidylate synthase [Dehalococcoides]|jgi:thymidylate synthase|uniref:Thymidylate synthase n=1 Tax=Dehalococcoides mccartyi (strain VS) TaxID=311424 RepID=D2BHQ5_DEHMV|nr:MULTISPECIES: thymidylate synthase [Dehalococcoides]ACZ61855.1 thymidylate synthase [Dehalococcoides mccartyi VS]AHB13513.1 thymidylate synthase [Dehalococcoides mccartyi GY50]AII57899.1 thymidylate synthase [Dehalococcoides mccartyi CG1]APH12417.1 thymidylate synthase [Dehalococcoides mccartyi]QYY58063.1 thymidylate synthase [Dehalococcoides mccartyi]